MKSLIHALVVAAPIAAPVAAFAQSNHSLTRAQVRAELVRIERAGYNRAPGENPYYPADVQAAEAKVAAMNGGTAIGGAQSGSSDAGRPTVSKADSNAMYSRPPKGSNGKYQGQSAF